MKRAFDVTYHATQQFRQRFPQYFKYDPYRIIDEARPATKSEWTDLEIQSINVTGKSRNQAAPKTLYYIWKDQVVFVGHKELDRIVIKICWQKLNSTYTHFPAKEIAECKPANIDSLSKFYKYLESVKDTPDNFSPNTARDLLIKSGVKTVLVQKLSWKYQNIKYKTFVKKCRKYLSCDPALEDKNLQHSRDSFKIEMEKMKMEALNAAKTATPAPQKNIGAKPRRIKYMVWHNSVKRIAYIESKVNPKDCEGTGWIKIEDRLIRGKILQCPHELKLYFVEGGK